MDGWVLCWCNYIPMFTRDAPGQARGFVKVFCDWVMACSLFELQWTNVHEVSELNKEIPSFLGFFAGKYESDSEQWPYHCQFVRWKYLLSGPHVLMVLISKRKHLCVLLAELINIILDSKKGCTFCYVKSGRPLERRASRSGDLSLAPVPHLTVPW